MNFKKDFISTFKIEGYLDPIIFTSVIDNRKYAISGSNWIEIPQEMTIDDVRKGFIDKREKFRKSKEFNNIMREVKSSKGDKTYRVSFKNNIWSCTCSGFTFRKKCTHTDSVKNDLKKLFIKNELPF